MGIEEKVKIEKKVKIITENEYQKKVKPKNVTIEIKGHIEKKCQNQNNQIRKKIKSKKKPKWNKSNRKKVSQKRRNCKKNQNGIKVGVERKFIILEKVKIEIEKGQNRKIFQIKKAKIE